MHDWSPDELEEAAALAGTTPCFLYDEALLREQVRRVHEFPAPYGLAPRYAMKACPTRAILGILREAGFGIDASSGYEVERAVRAGFPPSAISLSSQEFPADFAEWVRRGLRVNACSLRQLDRYGEAFPGSSVGLRFNPGVGSGGTAKTNVGGPSSSFGIWHEKVPEVRELLARHALTVERIHTHIGSGSDPRVWQKVAHLNLHLVAAFPEVHTLNLGGGYKIARTGEETATDLLRIGEPVAAALREFARETGRELRLEIEPGTFLVGNAGTLLARVHDIVDTGDDGYRFLKLDAGMTEILRPSLYAAQHPIRLVPRAGGRPGEFRPLVVVGHCCESGDLLTPAPDDPEALAPRLLPEPEPGDWCLLGGAGAYSASMSAKNYNSFPEAAELLYTTDSRWRLIRRRQTLDEMLAAEVVS